MIRANNLFCEYIPGKPVLFIDDLEIEAGEFVFIVGPSGIGKSTLIEIFGLMNNPFRSNPGKGSLTFRKNGTTIDLIDQWKQGDKKLCAIRDEHFAFIFQNTNLMPNFSVIENVALTHMLKGVNLKQSKEYVIPYLREIGIEQKFDDMDVRLISTGQRQRVAFIRALVARYNVLLGDEPTGNLDPAYAQNLMNMLSEELKKEQKTAIIVSHDISLAETYGNRIICLLKQPEDPFAHISWENSFRKSADNNTWFDHKGEPVLSLRDRLLKAMMLKTE